MQNKKGFTLIELLVVIAIIGILSGTVIVSMSGAQNSAKDARITSAMSQLRSAAEIYKLSHNTYEGFTAAGDGEALKNDIISQSPDSSLVLSESDSAYCVSITLNSGSVLCMDSTGKTGTACANQVCQ
ncbi:MAG: type II secretion system protein [Candidatus Pacebacteria bacterium]|nr:type II secretion system protein [Candidatus Paceibacterota bacterium]